MQKPRGAGVNVGASTGASGITIGTTTITGGATTQVLYNLAGVVQSTSTLVINPTAGQGPSIVAGTAVTNVPALNITQTVNEASTVFTAIKSTITQGAAGVSQLYLLDLWSGTSGAEVTRFRVNKDGTLLAAGSLQGTSGLISDTWSSIAADTGINKVSAGVVGIATGGSGVAGTIAATNYRVATKPVILGTAPSYASGGCLTGAGTVVTNSNGTAYFTVTLGTGCSGSQPVVLTLPAATTGWNCYARHVTTPASNIPRQSSAVSTTSVTFTNYAATTGLAAAWTDGDVFVGSCMGG